MNKTILVIAPYTKFNLSLSRNRVRFLDYLAHKNNVIVYNDSTENSFEIFMLKLIKQNINVDMIMYYLIYHDTKLLISINSYLLKKMPVKKKICFIEDFYLISIYHKFIKYLDFDTILLPMKNDKIKNKYKEYFDIPIKTWGFFHDTKLFRPMGLNKEHDILFYGSIDKKYYPLGNKIYNILLVLKNYLHDRIKIVTYYDKTDDTKYENLPILINKSRYVIATSGALDLFLKRYQEIILCGTKIIGDIPTGYDDVLKGHIYEIDKNDNDKEIVEKLLKYINSDDIPINNKSIGKWASLYDLENGYKLLDKYTHSVVYG